VLFLSSMAALGLKCATQDLTNALTNEKDMRLSFLREQQIWTRSLRNDIDGRLLGSVDMKWWWSILVPYKKVNIFMWRVYLGRLRPTRSNLLKRGVNMQSNLCVWCNRVEETENHLFFECLTAKELRAHLHSWWGNKGLPEGISEMSNVFEEAYRTKSAKIEIARRAVLWVLWNYRNESIFSGKTMKNKQLSIEVKLVAFNWFCSRGKKHGCST
jgi:hypothetical protein